ncbi:MAG: alanine racemase [Peptococcaceae bacterium]|jgi:alanine racemase|nr:alanine racemase [Peptococcaceae bacterium]MDH7524733.1 alanine racemase [Peptococcaceae bacterium]
MRTRPVWAEVDLNNIIHNYNQVRRLVGSAIRVMGVVKANAYGHGAVEVAFALDEAGADCFGVAIMNEAVQLREAGVRKPVMVLGWTPACDFERALKHEITLTIFSLEEAEELSRISLKNDKKAFVHIKIDTGMGRLGFRPDERGLEEAARAARLPGLEAEGVFTHLARADEADKTFTRLQVNLFQDFVQEIEKKAGFKFKIKHAANSAAVIDHPEAYFDMVRPGIMLYGLKPSSEVNLGKVELRQALSLRAGVSFVKDVPANVPISYGGRYVTPARSVIASLPLGYADGYSRLLSGRAEVICKGQRLPVVGRICMDQLMVNATALKTGIKQGDVVTLLGGDGDDFISADELARILGTINYEVVCMISSRVPRVYRR